MSKYALTVAEDGRILSVTYEKYAHESAVFVDSLPEGDVTEYRYVDGNYIHDPLPQPEPEPQSEVKVTTEDILNTLLGVTE